MEALVWGFVVESFSRSVAEFIGNDIAVMLSELSHVHAVGYVLAYEPVTVRRVFQPY